MSTPLTSAVRLSASADLALKFWLPCATAPNDAIHKFTRGASRKSWRDPPLTETPCFPRHGTCFRGVFDGRVNVSRVGEPVRSVLGTEHLPEEVRPRAKSKGVQTQSGEAEYIAQIRALLVDEFGVERDTITASGRRWRSYSERDTEIAKEKAKRVPAPAKEAVGVAGAVGYHPWSESL